MAFELGTVGDPSSPVARLYNSCRVTIFRACVAPAAGHAGPRRFSAALCNPSFPLPRDEPVVLIRVYPLAGIVPRKTRPPPKEGVFRKATVYSRARALTISGSSLPTSHKSKSHAVQRGPGIAAGLQTDLVEHEEKIQGGFHVAQLEGYPGNPHKGAAA